MTYDREMMSTRSGNFVLLEEVLDKAIELALKTINEKNPNLANKEEIAAQVGIGAIIFGDLTNDRVKNVNFTWDKALDFEGETSPYLQYTNARINSLIKKSGVEISDVNFKLLTEEKEIIKKISSFNAVVEQTAKSYKPHILARYLLDLAQTFNSYYQNFPILKQEDDLKKARLLTMALLKHVA